MFLIRREAAYLANERECRRRAAREPHRGIGIRPQHEREVRIEMRNRAIERGQCGRRGIRRIGELNAID